MARLSSGRRQPKIYPLLLSLQRIIQALIVRASGMGSSGMVTVTIFFSAVLNTGSVEVNAIPLALTSSICPVYVLELPSIVISHGQVMSNLGVFLRFITLGVELVTTL